MGYTDNCQDFQVKIDSKNRKKTESINYKKKNG